MLKINLKYYRHLAQVSLLVKVTLTIMEHNFIEYFNRSITLKKRLGDTEKVVSWKSKGLSTEKLTTPATTENILSPSIKWYESSNSCLIFKESLLKQKNATLTPPNIIIFLSFMN